MLVYSGLPAQQLPQIEVTKLVLPEGKKDGFVMLIPNLTVDRVLREWELFTSLMFPLVQYNEDSPRIPVTKKIDAKFNEYRTSGLFYPHLSQHTVDVYFTLQTIMKETDTLGVTPMTQLSLAIDFGNNHFLNTDNIFQVESVKHLLYKFYLNIEQNLTKSKQ